MWPQILADVLGCNVSVPRQSELTSRGAAMIAFEQPGVEVAAASRAAVGRVFHPDARATAIYRAAAERQRRLLQALC